MSTIDYTMYGVVYVSTLSEINYYLRTKKPDLFSLVETKLNDPEDVPLGRDYTTHGGKTNKK